MRTTGRGGAGAFVPAFVAFGALGLGGAGCSSGSSAAPASSSPTTACATCADAATLVTGQNTNPDGLAYPSPAGGYGHTARRGKTPGSIIQDFKFLGYPDASEANGLQTIALADYYDPCNKRLKLLHLSVAAVWCEPCNQETVALVASKAELATEQVVLIQALSDGPTVNTPATPSDLNYWIQENHSNFTEMLDPNLANLGTFFDAAAVPWNCDIDPRTMEILDDGTGWAGTVDAELAPGIAAAAEAPGYPIATTCP